MSASPHSGISRPLAEGSSQRSRAQNRPRESAAKSQPTKTRHFATLDGMRGVAAIAVVTTHAVPFIGGPYLPNGSLAVDLFFLLSGFVLTHAYSKRLDAGLTLPGFFAIRFTRLAPLYAVGALLGTLWVALEIASGRWELATLPTAFALLSLWLMMPSPMPNRFGEVFIINGPRWSLFYEDAVNIVMASSWGFFRSTFRLAVATAMFGVGLALSMRHYHTYELGWEGRTFLAGFFRASFPFFAGILLYRLHGTARNSTWLANLIPFLLVPLFAFNPNHMVRYSLFCIAIAFPALVLVGARFQPSSSRLCRFLGDVSYPLYVVHVPLIGLTECALVMNGLTPGALGHSGGLLLIALIIGLSWALAKTYDPIARAWLGSILLGAARSNLPR